MAEKLGAILVRKGFITQAQLDEGLKAQLIKGGRLGTNLVELDILDIDTLAMVLGEQSRYPVAQEADFDAVGEATLALLPAALAEKHLAFPLGQEGRRLKVAMVNPMELRDTDALGFATGLRIVPYVAPELRMYHFLAKCYGTRLEARYVRFDPSKRPAQAAASQAAHASAPRAPAAPPVRPALGTEGMFGGLAPGQYLSGDAEAEVTGLSTPPPASSAPPQLAAMEPTRGVQGAGGLRAAPPRLAPASEPVEELDTLAEGKVREEMPMVAGVGSRPPVLGGRGMTSAPASESPHGAQGVRLAAPPQLTPTEMPRVAVPPHAAQPMSVQGMDGQMGSLGAVPPGMVARPAPAPGLAGAATMPPGMAGAPGGRPPSMTGVPAVPGPRRPVPPEMARPLVPAPGPSQQLPMPASGAMSRPPVAPQPPMMARPTPPQSTPRPPVEPRGMAPGGALPPQTGGPVPPPHAMPPQAAESAHSQQPGAPMGPPPANMPMPPPRGAMAQGARLPAMPGAPMPPVAARPQMPPGQQPPPGLPAQARPMAPGMMPGVPRPPGASMGSHPGMPSRQGPPPGAPMPPGPARGHGMPPGKQGPGMPMAAPPMSGRPPQPPPPMGASRLGGTTPPASPRPGEAPQNPASVARRDMPMPAQPGMSQVPPGMSPAAPRNPGPAPVSLSPAPPATNPAARAPDAAPAELTSVSSTSAPEAPMPPTAKAVPGTSAPEVLAPPTAKAVPGTLAPEVLAPPTAKAVPGTLTPEVLVPPTVEAGPGTLDVAGQGGIASAEGGVIGGPVAEDAAGARRVDSEAPFVSELVVPVTARMAVVDVAEAPLPTAAASAAADGIKAAQAEAAQALHTRPEAAPQVPTPDATPSPDPVAHAGTEQGDAVSSGTAEAVPATADAVLTPSSVDVAPAQVGIEAATANTEPPPAREAEPAATINASSPEPAVTTQADLEPESPVSLAPEAPVDSAVPEASETPMQSEPRAPIELDDLAASSSETMELASTWEFVGWQGGEGNGTIGHTAESTWEDRAVDLDGPANPLRVAPPATELPLAPAWDFIQQPWLPPAGTPSEVVSSLLSAASASTETPSAGPAVTAEQVLAALEGVGTQGTLGKVVLAYCAGRFRRAFLLGESFGLARVGHAWGPGSDSSAVSALKVDLEAPSLFTAAMTGTGPSFVNGPRCAQDEAIFSALGGATQRLLVVALRSRGRPVAFVVADPGSEPVDPSLLDDFTRVIDKASEAYDRLPSHRGA